VRKNFTRAALTPRRESGFHGDFAKKPFGTGGARKISELKLTVDVI
jgi:hypothetical protein